MGPGPCGGAAVSLHCEVGTRTCTREGVKQNQTCTQRQLSTDSPEALLVSRAARSVSGHCLYTVGRSCELWPLGDQGGVCRVSMTAYKYR